MPEFTSLETEGTKGMKPSLGYFVRVFSGKNINTIKKKLRPQTARILDGVKRRKGEFWFLILSPVQPHFEGESISAKMFQGGAMP